MNLTDILHDLGETLPASAHNDLPMIRTAINDSIDAALKGGEMKRYPDFDQARAVAKVRRLLTQRR